MATYTWRGGHGTGSDPNDASAAANWLTSDGATPFPGAGDTVVLPAATAGGPLTLDATGLTLDNNSISVGAGDRVNLALSSMFGGQIAVATGSTLAAFDSTISGVTFQMASNTTLEVSGDTQQTGTLINQNDGTAYGTVDGTAITGGSNIVQGGSSLFVHALGNVISDANLVAATAGGSLTIQADALQLAGAAATPGLLFLTNSVINMGEAVQIASGSNAAVANNAELIVADGTASITAQMLPVSGAIYLVDTATADIASALPGPQTVFFNGPNQILKIENATSLLQNFGANLAGFGAGDTVELLGLTGLSASYANGLLQLSQGSINVGALGFSAAQALDSGLGNSGFTVTAAAGNTFITTSAVNDALLAVTSGATVEWGNAAAWSGGAPTAAGVAVVGLNTNEIKDFLSGTQDSYTLLVSAAATAGSVVLSDPLASMVIAAPLTLQRPQPGASSGAAFSVPDGTVEIAAGGTLTAASFQASVHAKLQVEAGGQLLLTGQQPDGAPQGWQALEVENNAVIDGTITAAGAIQIGRNSPSGANVTLENGGHVTASFTQLAGRAYGRAFMSVSGAGTVWRDVGDAANTADAGSYLGDMLIGGGGVNGAGFVQTNFNAPNGSAQLQIGQGATVSESGSAILGMVGVGVPGDSLNSNGQVTLQNNATWEIGGQLEVGGSHRLGGDQSGGSGHVAVQFGGRLLLGTAESAGLYKVAFGASQFSTGSIEIGGFGSNAQQATLDTGGGPMAIGEFGAGQVMVSGAGNLVAGQNATAGYAWGMILGDNFGSSGALYMQAQAGTTEANVIVNGNMVVGNYGTGTVYDSQSRLTVNGSLFAGGNPAGPGTGSGSLFVSNGTANISGNVTIYPGSTLNMDGGVLEIGSGGGAPSGALTVDAGHTLSVGGTLQMGSTLNINGVLEASGSGQTLDIPNGVPLAGNGSFAIDGGATLQIDQTVNGKLFAFAPGNGGLAESVIVSGLSGTTTLQGFYGSDSLDITGLNFATASPNVNYIPNADPTTGGTAHIFGRGVELTFAMTGAHPGGFTVSGDAAGGTRLTANDAAPCFAAGTRIATSAGPVAVEALAPGMTVQLADGGTAPIIWLGHRRVDCARHPRPHDVLPVRVAKGAFGPGQPSRDLILSPDHAVFAGGGLIPVRYLLNGRTVVQETVESVTFWHVELPRHAVLLAEGLACESFLDTGNRAAFANGGTAVQLHPDFALQTWAARACAPLVRDGAALARVRQRLLTRAKTLGHAITRDAGLRVLADGAELAVRHDGGLLCVSLPPGATTLRLHSRTWVPAQMRPAETDSRRLGIAIARLYLDGRAVALDSPGLTTGWHAAEPHGRWTDGGGILAVTGLREVAFVLADDGQYWQDSAARTRRRRTV